MILPAYSNWWAGSAWLSPVLSPRESAILVLLAASLLVYRTFRERYLLISILAWLAYFSSLWLQHGGTAALSPAYRGAVTQVAFLLAICLFSAAVFLYTHARRLLLPLLLIALSVMGYAVLRAFLWPDSPTLRVALEAAYRFILVAAACQLIRFRWARAEIGPWLVGIGLLTLHLEWAPLTSHLPAHFSLLGDLLLGISILLVVFDDYRMRTRRLSVINALTLTITRAQQQGPMMATALEELKGLMRAKSAWFRMQENEQMVITQHIGLSEEFLRDRGSIAMDDTLQAVLRDARPSVHKTSEASDVIRPYLKKEGFQHVVLVPILGRKSAIGTLSLGSRRSLHYAPDELEFLATTGQQLGLAVENMRLVEQIVRSHRQWANTFDSIQDFVLLHDAEFRVMKANHSLLLRLGKAPADVTGKTCEEVLPREHTSWQQCPYCRLGGEGLAEVPDACFGGYSLVSTSSYVDQSTRQKGTIHVVRDITDRAVAEEKYRMLFEQVQEGVFVATPEGELLDCNDAFVRMLGYPSREELMARNIDTEVYVSGEQRDALWRQMEQHNFVRNFEVTLRRKDGVLLTAIESSFATRDTSGKLERYQGFLLDITQKKQAEDEIRRRNRELNALNAMAVIATQSFDLDEILNLTLRQVISLLGAETGSIYLSDADDETFRRRAGWGLRSTDRARFSEVQLAGGFGDLVTRSRTEVLTAEYLPHLPPLVAEFIRVDGFSSWIWVLLWSKDKPIGIMGISSREAREYTSNDENLLVAIGRQLATTIEKVRLYEETCRAYEDLRLAQEQLLQSEKMSAVGQLIAGVAHELNNPLTAILGYAQLLESEGLNERATDFVGKLFKQAQRTHRVVQNLLSFARQRKPQKHSVDICKVLEETLALRDYDFKVNDIKLERELETDLPAVTADSHQLEQVFLNIINNSVDAMLEAGGKGMLKVRAYCKEEFLHIEFQDSGPGIKEPTRIFDPFYTTKSVGKGTGLGLSICYGIVKEHGGEIKARNRDEGGAVLEVILPAAGRTAAPDAPAAPASRREMVLEGEILLVEDEEAVLEFERDVLAGSGAQVVALMKPEEIKSRLAQRSFDALIINGKMPGGWNARDTYRWLAETYPGMEKHVLFTFSSVAEPEVRNFLQEKNVPYLAKPFEVADLIAQVRRLLQKSQAAVAG
ncbi:MAG: PAS domain S-box protein [Acidobacteria bacterium]|nr:PAS domain S-box protein [Acidobacteriota bacterium]